MIAYPHVIVAATALLTAVWSCSVVTAQHAPIPADLAAARDAIWRAWFTYDRPVLERMLPPEFVGIGWGGGAFDTRETALAASAEFVRGGGTLRRIEFTDDRVQRFGATATVFSNYLVEWEQSGQVTTQRGRATEVFVQKDGVWTNPAWHLDSGR